MSNKVVFGEIDSEKVYEITIGKPGGMELRVITYGAILRDLKVPVPGGFRHVLLGFEKLGAYVEHRHWHIGAVPGRVANRIAHGRFYLDGQQYQLPRNQDGVHTLHSGDRGFGARNWSIVELEDDSVTLALISVDGDQGFPGKLTTTVTYRLIEPSTLQISYLATTDKATPVNLTNHAYFNLDGKGDVLSHRMVLAADYFTPTGSDLIPTGEVLAVDDTPWDFRKERPIMFETPSGPFHYDGNVVLRQSGALNFAARVTSSRGDVKMEVWTTQPGLQVFDAATLNLPTLGLNGVPMSPRSGFCLEPQFFPDSINKPHFSNCVLMPTDIYTHTTEYRFAG